MRTMRMRTMRTGLVVKQVDVHFPEESEQNGISHHPHGCRAKLDIFERFDYILQGL